MTIIPPTPAGETAASTAAEGFLLLTISNVTLSSTSPANPIPYPLTGLLSLECVTLNVADPLERDVWLVLRIEPAQNSTATVFELPLPSTQRAILSRPNHRYSLPMTSSGGGELILTLPAPNTTNQKEDVETLEVILAQYLVLQIEEDAPPPFEGSSTDFNPDGDLKGRLILVDEDNGQVVGTLGEQFSLQEDASLRAEGSEKAPVLVEIPDEEDEGSSSQGARRPIFVHTIAVDDSDWVSKTAGFLGCAPSFNLLYSSSYLCNRRGIVVATNAVATGMTSASNYYISRSKPTAQPIAFSENTQKNIKRIHTISGKAVKVTSKTTGLIHQTVERLADRVAGKGKGQVGSNYSSQSGLNPAAATGMPYGSPRSASQSTMSKDASKEWAHLHPGGTPASFQPPPYQPSPTPGSQHGIPPLPPRRRLLNRLLTSTDLLLTTLESSASHLITHTSTSLSAVATHKYGPDAGRAVGMVGDSVKNVAVVYIDMRGVGRRALLKVAGKRMIKAKMGGKEVVFQEQGMGRGQVFPNGLPEDDNPPHKSDGYTPPAFPPPQAGDGKGKLD
jgi:spartin